MSILAREESRRRRLEQGDLDFSEHASVGHAAAPGTLIRAHTANCKVRVTDVIIYNGDASSATIIFYDEDSNVKLIVSVGGGETAGIDFKASIVYGKHNIYARTTAEINAEVTVAGREVPLRWQ